MMIRKDQQIKKSWIFPSVTSVARAARAVCVLLIFSCLCFKITSGEPRIGEKLIYDVKLGKISAGTQVVCVADKVKISDHETYRITSHTTTTPFFSIFYRMDNHIETLIDCETFSIRKMTKEINEGSFHRKDIMLFDLESGRGFIQRDGYAETINIPPAVLDIASIPYYLRELDLKIGQVISMDIITDGGIKKYAAVVESLDQIKTPLMKFKAYRVVEKTEKITVWIANDESRLPVKIQIGTNVGEITGILKKVE